VIRWAIAAMFTLSVSGLCGAGAPPARLARFVVLRTAGDVYTGERVRYDAGHFVVEGGNVSPRVPEGDVVHLVFVPALDAPGLSTAVGLAMRVAAAGRLKRLTGRRGDVLNALTRLGGVFFLASDDPSKVFPDFVRKTKDPDLAGVLCYELVQVCQQRGQKDAVAGLLEGAARQFRGSDRGFVCTLMRAAVLRAAGDPAVKEAMRDLFQDYGGRRHEITRFRDFALGELPWRGRPEQDDGRRERPFRRGDETPVRPGIRRPDRP